ncbi:MAG: NmrA family NAD(P)-binding protein [Rhizobium sp.]|nr:NmrA family NAD(P)-binding protein [Rhizobium sp.]
MSKILVTGASGHLGRLVIQHLIESRKVSPSDIAGGSRDTARLADLAALGVETRRIDFDDKASLETAFSGIDKLLIVSTDELGTPGKRLAQHSAAVEAAKAAGVGRIFYTSMPQPEDSEITFKGDHLGTEQAIKASGLAYTIFRNGWYMENLFMSLPQALASGHWYTAAGTGRIAHIAREDIARAIAAGLAKPAEGNVTYTLTGETAHTTEEIAALVRDVTGKPLVVMRFRPSFFPFTEPSFEVDIQCDRSSGPIVKFGEGTDWMEILGCGMVHPNVLRAGGLDPDEYQGFAWGMGLDRIAMLKYGMPDLRDFFNADVRWMSHYGFRPLDVPTLFGGLSA